MHENHRDRNLVKDHEVERNLCAVNEPLRAAQAATESGTTDKAACAYGNPQGNLQNVTPCEILKTYPRPEGKPLGFEGGEMSMCDSLWALRPRDSKYLNADEQNTFEIKEGMKCTVPGDPLFNLATGATSTLEKKAIDPALIPTEEQYQDRTNRFSQLRSEVVSSCCGKNQKCAAIMNRTGVEFCGHSKIFQSCDGFWYHFWHSEDERHSSLTLAAKRLRRVPLDPYMKNVVDDYNAYPRPILRGGAPGVVAMSGLFKSPGVWQEKDAYVRHELAHACSYAMDQALLDDPGSGVEAAKNLLIRDANLTSEMTSSRRAVLLLKSMNAELGPYAYACSDRYRAVVMPMFKGCQFSESYWAEESFAEMVRIQTSPFQNQANLLKSEMCSSTQEQFHPAPRAMTECLMQTSPKFRAIMSAALGCQ